MARRGLLTTGLLTTLRRHRELLSPIVALALILPLLLPLLPRPVETAEAALLSALTRGRL